MSLPKNKGSVASFLSSIGIPEVVATTFAEGSKRDLIKAVGGWMIYSSS
jgi:hypothetical protein